MQSPLSRLVVRHHLRINLSDGYRPRPHHDARAHQRDATRRFAPKPRRICRPTDGTRELRIFVNAARSRGEPLDMCCSFGPPGLGKTTLAAHSSTRDGVGFRATSGPVIAKSGDLAALLTNLEDGDVLFIDEIHASIRQSKKCSIRHGGPRARPHDRRRAVGAIGADRPARFTLVGATTRRACSPRRSRPLRNSVSA